MKTVSKTESTEPADDEDVGTIENDLFNDSANSGTVILMCW